MTRPDPRTPDLPAADDPLLRLIGAYAGAGKIAVHNARGGFACNSSSTHSIVILGDTPIRNPRTVKDGSYDESDFALTTIADKLRYLAGCLDVEQDPDLAETWAQIAAAHTYDTSQHAHVDSDSTRDIPRDWAGDSASGQFLADFAEFLTREDVAILGGSSGRGGSRWHHPDMLHLPGIIGSWRARRDRDPDGTTWWVLFNDADGTKLRLSFTPGAVTGYREADDWAPYRTAQFTPTAASTPELLDIKLTDRCAFEKDCQFCYMGSTRDGVEADPARVMSLLEAAAAREVFEVAFGGGEPTLWEPFGQILAYTRSLGIIPNFTTKNYAWLTGPNAARWLELVGAVAFSVNTRAAMDQLTRRIDRSRLAPRHTQRITIQLIPDLVPAADFSYILSEATQRGHRVTLLGYKHTGRGATFTPAYRREPGWWIATCQTLGLTPVARTSIAIDTALAAQSKDALAAAGVPDWMFHTSEGRFSAYVDAVNERIGPSSYCAPAMLSPLDLNAPAATIAGQLIATFGTYRDISDTDAGVHA